MRSAEVNVSEPYALALVRCIFDVGRTSDRHHVSIFPPFFSVSFTMSTADVANPASIAGGGDNESIMTAVQSPVTTGSSPRDRPAAATPDDDEAAQAMAEVAAMEGSTQARRADRAAEEALMGATAAAEDGFAGFEVKDDSGDRVMGRFLQFLGDL